MAAAKALAQSEVKPKRSVLFILIGGEECGLYGSKFYADHPLFPIEKTVFMINLDMVGNGTGFYISSGKSYPGIYSHFEKANQNYLHRKMEASEWRKSYSRPRSDAANFENAGIKTLSLWTSGGVFPVYYHHPKDKTDVLTPEIMEDAAKLLYLGILGVANDGI
jgi:Zn-dependent M28 family amino/carboxypeptidase